jgi:virulence-associated protein VapD
MFAIAFDLVVAETARHHPKGVSRAYADIGATLANFGFDRVQGCLYTTPSEDLANLFSAITALKRCHGCRRRFATSVLSASSSGRILPDW